MPLYAMVIVVGAANEDGAHYIATRLPRQTGELIEAEFIGEPWRVRPKLRPRVEPCPVCGAEGEEQPCIENGRPIDDHAERGGDPQFDTLECFNQHPERDVLDG
jgi:hypothetical protein